MLENGCPALLLHLNYIYTHFDLMGFENTTHEIQERDVQTYLLFSLEEEQLLACPLTSVRHIIALDQENAYKCSGWQIITHQEQEYPTINLYRYLKHESSPQFMNFSYALLFHSPHPLAIPVGTLIGIHEDDQSPQLNLKRNGITGNINYNNRPVEIIDMSYIHQQFAHNHAKI